MNQNINGLGNLADVVAFNHPIDIAGYLKDDILKLLSLMLIIRKTEEKISCMYEKGFIKCPCHLGVGQEAIPVGVSKHLRKTDRVFGAHRSHAHYLGMDGDVYQLFAETLGKVTGCSKGMGGSQHVYSKHTGFYGSVPIVGATIPIAVGAGMAAKMDGNNDVSVSYFGDGAVEEGAFHESLNLASAHRIPVLFVCENNMFASHLHIHLRQPDNSVSRFAHAHHIFCEKVDGNDVIAVLEAAKNCIEYIRNGKGPAFLECVTYRWKGHVGPKEDMDVGVKRNVELALWKGRDPIGRLKQALLNKSMITDIEIYELDQKLQNHIDIAWEKALLDPYPENRNLLDWVYSLKEGVTIE